MAYTTIDDPSAYFQTATYTGSGGTGGHAIVNDGNSDLQPDLVWLKQRSYASSHRLMDSTRGGNKMLESDTVNAEATYGYISSFDTDGFTLGYSDNSFDGYGREYVGWQWKANGGTTSSNTSGTITTTVQANTDAGFSIVTWAGNASNATMGHGLGTTPQVIISKARGTTNDWNVYHRDLDATAPYNYLLNLHNTNARSAATGSWGASLSDINSNTFYKKYWINYNTNMIAYCFAEKQGYSKFGKYIGNGSLNGPFIYTGFKPAFVIVKQRNTARPWQLFDNKRDGYNENQMPRLQPNDSAAEVQDAGASMDLLSNGFKVRSNQTGANQSGGTYIYMAFAENPFVTSTGIPTTAR